MSLTWIASGALLAASPVAAPPPPQAADTACVIMEMSVAGRLSPLDSITVPIDGHTLKVCYGRPSSRGRIMIGGREVPFGRLWRTGANEPTMLHTTTAMSVAGIEIESGTYSLYMIPREDEWTLIINRSITQWGHIAQYTYRVRREEVGRAAVRHERTGRHVETLTLSSAMTDDGPELVLEWERSRIRIPIRSTGS